MPSKKRLTVGLLVGSLDDVFQTLMWHTVQLASEEFNTDLYLIVGNPPKAPFLDRSQQNIIYNIVDPQKFDGLLIISGTMGQFLTQQELYNFCDKFKSIPRVSIGQRIPGIPCVLIDNHTGIRELVQHLVNFHQFKKIAFIKGPENHQEAEERFDAYRQALESNHIPFDEKLVLLCHWDDDILTQIFTNLGIPQNDLLVA